MKTLFITEQVPANATILLIDVEEKYFEGLLEEIDNEYAEKQITQRLIEMRKTLVQLKEHGHTILSSTNGNVHPLIEDLIDKDLYQWDSGGMDNDSSKDIAQRHILDPQLISEVKNHDQVVVAGLWKELCVYIVARKLQEAYGSKVLLLNDKQLTFEDGLSLDEEYDNITLEDVCQRDNVSLIKTNEEVNSI